MTLRFQKEKELSLIQRQIRSIIKQFHQKNFSINDIPQAGNTERLFVNETAFWNNKEAIKETLVELEKIGSIKLLNNNEIEIIDESLLSEVYMTPEYIFKEKINFIKNNLSKNKSFDKVIYNLKEAEKSLAVLKNDYSDVGHYCQLANEDFFDALCAILKINTTNIARDKTSEKFKKIKEKINNSNTDVELIEALHNFWGISSDNNEKSEHRPKNKETDIELAKRSYLFTSIIIEEIIRHISLHTDFKIF